MSGRDHAFGKDVGLLIIRLGIGAMFVTFGLAKWKGGETLWAGLGGAMKVFGITVWPVFWGFMAMASELVGGAMLCLGLFVRPFAALMCFTMITASLMLVASGANKMQYAHAVDMAVVFAGLVAAGGGRFALGACIPSLRGKWFG